MTMAQQNKVSAQLYETSYAQSACKVGIVHVGYGAFHRAHQAIYVDDYMEKSGDLNWGIAAVNLRSDDAPSFSRSSQVDEGYVIKTTDVDGTLGLRKVRSHLDYLDWSSSPELTENLLASPDVHLVTITVTESGYYFDSEAGLNLRDETIAREIAGGQAQTIYGFLANSLNKRRSEIDQPVTILCCDNIRANGKMLRKNFISYLRACEQIELADWVKSNVSFPCSMVDRITPRATADLQAEIADMLGPEFVDPIHAEAFSQWVLEDDFAGPMPDLALAGVEVVDDVDPYEEAKIRILNGGHTGLTYLGALAGHQTFDAAMLDPKLREFFDNFEQKEVLPGLQIDLPFNKADYLKQIADRFCNHAIADQLERICMDGYSKVQIYIRPTLESCLKQSINPVYMLDCIASWYVYARRFKAGTMPIHYHEPYWEQLSPLLDAGQEMRFATDSQLWGELPQTYSQFPGALVSAIEKMEQSWPD